MVTEHDHTDGPPPTDPKDTQRTEQVTSKLPAFDDSRFFVALQAHIDRSFDEFKRELREDRRQDTNRSVSEHEKTRKHVAELTTKVETMWKHLYGPTPPSTDGELAFSLTEPATKPDSRSSALVNTDASPKTGPKTIPESISEHDSTIAGIQGQIIAVDAKIGRVDAKVDALTELQKKQMGMRDDDDRRAFRKLLDGFLWLFTERAGRKFALTLIAAISGLATSCGTIYALNTGRLPMPNAPVHPQVGPSIERPPPPTDRPTERPRD